MDTVPKEVSDLIFELLRCNKWHHEKDTLSLLAHLKEGSADHQEAIRIIIEQSPSTFHPNVLFLIAKQQHTKSTGSDAAEAAEPKPIDLSVFNIIEKAFAVLPSLEENLQPYPPLSTFEHIVTHMKWLFDCCFYRTPRVVAKDPVFKKLIAIMCSDAYFDGKCNILLLLIERLKEKGTTMIKTRQQVFQALMTSYHQHYSNQLRIVSHTGYKSLVRSMKKHLDSCRDLIPQGEKEFAKVVDKIKVEHSRKKKLIEIINEELR
jgi:hypothetical protein